MKFFLLTAFLIIPLFGIIVTYADSIPLTFLKEDGSSNLDMTVEQGTSLRLPLTLSIPKDYDLSSMYLSLSPRPVPHQLQVSEIVSPPFEVEVTKIKSWITPESIPAYDSVGRKMTNVTVSILTDSNTTPGKYVLSIVGDGSLKKKGSEDFISFNNQTVATIHLDVTPHESDLTMDVGSRTVHMGQFCVQLGSATSCASGPQYEEYPITISSKHKTEVTLEASPNLLGWIKFIPEKLAVDQNNATVKMILAGIEMPFTASQESIPLAIKAESKDDFATSFLPIIKINDISVIKSISPINLQSEIAVTANQTSFGVFGTVYDPDSSKESISVSLTVIGLVDSEQIVPMPSWLDVEMPPPFTLNAAEPFYFMIKATANSALPGIHFVAVKETIDGHEFVENIRVNIQDSVQLGGPPLMHGEDGAIRPIQNPPPSPLKQFKSGVPTDKITCKEGLEIVIKTEHRHQPMCVKPSTKAKMIQIGLAQLIRITE